MLKSLLTGLFLSALPAQPSLRMTVHVEEDRGVVRCALYDSAADWLTTRVVDGASARVLGGKATCVFLGVPAGRYAISAYHDQDEDGALDTNLFGIPSEAYCASREARGRLGPPSFDDAVFEYDGGAKTLSARAE